VVAGYIKCNKLHSAYLKAAMIGDANLVRAIRDVAEKLGYEREVKCCDDYLLKDQMLISDY
jgi:hypothetical protein